MKSVTSEQNRRNTAIEEIGMVSLAQMKAYLRGARVLCSGTREEVVRRYMHARELAAEYAGWTPDQIQGRPAESLRADVRGLGLRCWLPKRELASILWERFSGPVTPRAPARAHQRLMHVWVSMPDGTERLWGRVGGQSHRESRRIAEEALRRESDRAMRAGYPPDAVSVVVDDVREAYRHNPAELSGH